ncbi:MAG: PilZ domain-containing protein, partial [Elusimicrobia bacterium]|nr:PilZ domain-containing protein [Elusimicrobiota bacterium]
GERVGRAVIRDISYSGMRIETLEALEQGETIFLDFDIAGRFVFQKVPMLITRVYRHSGSLLLGLTFQKGYDRRHIRHALTYVVESST